MIELPLNHIFIPSKIPSKKLMIILHGRGDSSRGFTFLPEYLAIEDMNYILLDAPYDYYGGFSWYDLPPNQLEGIEYSRKVLTDVLDTLFEKQFNAHESFLFGFHKAHFLLLSLVPDIIKYLQAILLSVGTFTMQIDFFKRCIPMLRLQIGYVHMACTMMFFPIILPKCKLQYYKVVDLI